MSICKAMKQHTHPESLNTNGNLELHPNAFERKKATVTKEKLLPLECTTIEIKISFNFAYDKHLLFVLNALYLRFVNEVEQKFTGLSCSLTLLIVVLFSSFLSLFPSLFPDEPGDFRIIRNFEAVWSRVLKHHKGNNESRNEPHFLLLHSFLNDYESLMCVFFISIAERFTALTTYNIF